jgi:hypothetical protein
MAAKPPTGTRIYRITHVDNLAQILTDGGVHAPAIALANSVQYKPIHNTGIQDQRSRTQVPCGPRGCVHDYVPFYFAPRSPMLYAILKGKVDSYQGGQEEVIYLVAIAEQLAAAGVAFAFTDGHAIMRLTNFFDDLARLDRVNWDVIRGQWFHDTDQFPDRKRQRQAEFLVHQFCPIGQVVGIGTMNDAMKARVESIVAAHGSALVVKTLPAWYF